MDREKVVVQDIENKVQLSDLVSNRVDRWVWLGEKEECYSTKEGYKELNKREVVYPMKKWAPIILNNLAPLKVNVFVWKLLQDRIPSRLKTI